MRALAAAEGWRLTVTGAGEFEDAPLPRQPGRSLLFLQDQSLRPHSRADRGPDRLRRPTSTTSATIAPAFRRRPSATWCIPSSRRAWPRRRCAGWRATSGSATSPNCRRSPAWQAGSRRASPSTRTTSPWSNWSRHGTRGARPEGGDAPLPDHAGRRGGRGRRRRPRRWRHRWPRAPASSVRRAAGPSPASVPIAAAHVRAGLSHGRAHGLGARGAHRRRRGGAVRQARATPRSGRSSRWRGRRARRLLLTRLDADSLERARCAAPGRARL